MPLWGLCVLMVLWMAGPAASQVLLPELWARVGTMWTGMDKRALVWGSFRTPSSVHPSETDNWQFEVYAKPELRIWQPSPRIWVTGYALVSAHRDGARITWNSKLRGGVGAEVHYQLSDAVRLAAGVRWDNEYQYLQKTYLTGNVVTGDLSIWKTWDLEHAGHPLLRRSQVILSGWSNLRYPASLAPAERDNVLVQGSLKLALAVPIGQTRLRAAPFVSLTAKADRAGRDWNNQLQPAVGFDIKAPLGKGGELSLGLRAVHQSRFRSKTSFTGTQVVAGFFKNF